LIFVERSVHVVVVLFEEYPVHAGESRDGLRRMRTPGRMSIIIDIE
jgi:hypothetical protein